MRQMVNSTGHLPIFLTTNAVSLPAWHCLCLASNADVQKNFLVQDHRFWQGAGDKVVQGSSSKTQREICHQVGRLGLNPWRSPGTPWGYGLQFHSEAVDLSRNTRESQRCRYIRANKGREMQGKYISKNKTKITRARTRQSVLALLWSIWEILLRSQETPRTEAPCPSGRQGPSPAPPAATFHAGKFAKEQSQLAAPAPVLPAVACGVNLGNWLDLRGDGKA